MAVYINLGIDCGKSCKVADSVEAHFRGFKLHLPNIGGIECEIWKSQHLDHWILGVWPQGLGYATQGHYRPELLPYEQAIKAELYRHLSLIDGYRRALFGGEAHDLFSEATAEELLDHDYVGMIYAESEFPVPPPGRKVKSFSKGYSIVLSQDERVG